MAPQGWCLLFCYPLLINVHQFFTLKRYFLLQFAKCLFTLHLKTVPRAKLLQERRAQHLTAIRIVGRCKEAPCSPQWGGANAAIGNDQNSAVSVTGRVGQWWLRPQTWSQVELDSNPALTLAKSISLYEPLFPHL